MGGKNIGSRGVGGKSGGFFFKRSSIILGIFAVKFCIYNRQFKRRVIIVLS